MVEHDDRTEITDEHLVYPAGVQPSEELREELGLADDELIVIERIGARYLSRTATIESSSPVKYRLGPQLSLDHTIKLEKEAAAQGWIERSLRDLRLRQTELST